LKKEQENLQQLDRQLRGVFSVKFSFKNVIGIDSDFGKIALKASKSDGSVFLLGESGVGKEVIAQSIHSDSQRRDEPFVDINCAALPENLLESELFGYAPGAFTGANKNGKMGLFEVASGGTIFLDEISEMPLTLQSKLLRALQEKHIRKLGENRNTDIDVRVIAATNRNLENLVSAGSFRKDLFYRLAMFVIEIPPLRERKRDIDHFMQYFLNERHKKTQHKISMSKEAKELFLSYYWPGNVRELENAIGYACDVMEGDIIGILDLPGHITKRKYAGEAISGMGIDKVKWQGKKSLGKIMEEVEKQILTDGIKEYGKNLEGRKKWRKFWAYRFQRFIISCINICWHDKNQLLILKINNM
jgi:transcriptional regulator with PAS, ATPase and Fis domain